MKKLTKKQQAQLADLGKLVALRVKRGQSPARALKNATKYQARPPKKKAKPKKRAAVKKTTPSREVVPEAEAFTASNTTSTSHVEHRFFRGGSAFLGYVEGRPGVLGVLSAVPSRGGEPVRELTGAALASRVAAREEASERLKNSPPGQSIADEGGAAFSTWLDDMLTVWDFCEDGGALVEAEVDY